MKTVDELQQIRRMLIERRIRAKNIQKELNFRISNIERAIGDARPQGNRFNDVFVDVCKTMLPIELYKQVYNEVIKRRTKERIDAEA